MSEIICYGVQRNVSEKYVKKKPLKEMSRTLLAEKSFCGGGVLIVQENTFSDEELNKIGEDYAMNPSKYENNDVRVFPLGHGYLETGEIDGAVYPTIRESATACYNNPIQEQGYAIRKLTPRECFRLMGVKDEDFDKIEKNQSNSSLYHLAGDSIVVDVLMAIFKQMI